MNSKTNIDPTKKTRRILYVGNDKGYWTNIHHVFQSRYGHMNLDFKTIENLSDDIINEILLDILEYDPHFIYIDLSVNFQIGSKLGLYLKRLNAFKYIPVSAFVEDESKIDESLYLGFDFTFIKSGETHDVVYHPFYFIFPKEALKKDFALAKFNQKAKLLETFRIGYFSPEHMHVEANASWKVGDLVKLNTNISEEYNKNPIYEVISCSDSGMYYNFNHSFDLAYKFIGELHFDDSVLEEAMQIEDQIARQKTISRIEEERAQRKAEHEQNRQKIKKSMNQWVLSMQDSKDAKTTKILIIDEELGFLKTEKRKLDSFNFTIRLQTKLEENFHQIEKLKPQIIVYSIPEFDFSDMEDLSEEEKISEVKKVEIKLTGFFSKLVDKVKSIEDYTPFIIIFNCLTLSSKSFQDSFRYELIIANKEKVNLDLVMQMAELFEKKQKSTLHTNIDQKILELRKQDPAKYGRLTREDFIDSRYYVGKSHKLSRGSFHHEVELKAISESEVYFSIGKDLELEKYYLETPFKMVVTLVPQEGKKAISDKGAYLYKGLIHSIGENEKKKLRQFVNEIYTKHKTEERKKEEEAFKKLNSDTAQAEQDKNEEEPPENN